MGWRVTGLLRALDVRCACAVWRYSTVAAIPKPAIHARAMSRASASSKLLVRAPSIRSRVPDADQALGDRQQEAGGGVHAPLAGVKSR